MRRNLRLNDLANHGWLAAATLPSEWGRLESPMFGPKKGRHFAEENSRYPLPLDT